MPTPFSELIKSKTPLLVDFHAEWCGPCKTMSPIVEELANELKTNLKVIKIDTDKNQQVSSAYSIQGIPTFILFKEGKILWRQSGAMPKHEMMKALRQFL
jgi:thioredoxin 1